MTFAAEHPCGEISRTEFESFVKDGFYFEEDTLEELPLDEMVEGVNRELDMMKSFLVYQAVPRAEVTDKVWSTRWCYKRKVILKMSGFTPILIFVFFWAALLEDVRVSPRPKFSSFLGRHHFFQLIKALFWPKRRPKWTSLFRCCVLVVSARLRSLGVSLSLCSVCRGWLIGDGLLSVWILPVSSELCASKVVPRST